MKKVVVCNEVEHFIQNRYAKDAQFSKTVSKCLSLKL
jgi:hypothetical protein